MFEFITDAVGVVFSPLLGLPPIVAVGLMAVLLTTLSTSFYRFLIDQNKVREIKAKLSELGKQAKKQDEPEKAKEAMSEMLKLQNSQMKMSFRPMIPTLLVVAVILPWMAVAFTGQVALLPVDLPYFGPDFGWLMWYFVVSIPTTQIARKLMGVES